VLSGLTFATAILYLVLAALAWSRGSLATAQAGPAIVPASNASWQRFAVPVALVLHAAVLYESLFGHESINLGLGNAISLIVWLTVLIYWIGSFFYDVGALQALVLPVAGVGALAAFFLPSHRVLGLTETPALAAHLVFSLAAYSLFTIASLHAVMMSVLERGLHHGTLPRVLRDAPPLMAMETMLFHIIGLGFIFLTFGLITGFVFSDVLFGKALTYPHNVHKVVFAGISWLVFAGLLLGRKIYGWRGRVAVRWTLTGFAMLLLAYVGSKFVLEVILQRA
jgi:ABC-type uncharacterized transport system permease subunit